ncbi:MAG: hypothetical protein ACI8RA_002812 [Chlamydiales bacterium]|jgi:hypothetical protein
MKTELSDFTSINRGYFNEEFDRLYSSSSMQSYKKTLNKELIYLQLRPFMLSTEERERVPSYVSFHSNPDDFKKVCDIYLRFLQAK